MKKFLLTVMIVITTCFCHGAEQIIITPSDMKASNSSTSYVTSYFSFKDTDTAKEFKATQVNPNTGQIRVNNTGSSAFNLYNTSEISGLKSITLAADRTTLGTWYMSTSDNAAITSSVTASSTNVKGVVNGNNVTFTVPTGVDVSYFHINLTAIGSGTVKFTSITIEVESGGDAELAESEIAWSAESYTATLDEEYLFPTLINPNELPVTYESSNASVATIDSNGTVAIVGAGKTTISAEFAGDETYKASTVSYELEVIDPNDIATEISVDDFGKTNSYTAYAYTDNYGVAYSTVYYHSSGLMQYNTSNDNGKGSGLNITANNSDYIVKSIDIEIASGGKGVNVYASSTPFDALVKTTTPNYNSYTKVNSSAITTSTTNININAKAFAIIPNTSGSIQISKITVHYALDVSDTREDVTLEFSESECSAVYDEDFSEPTLTVNPEAAKEEVKYSSNNTGVATVDPTSGEVTLVGAGNATITAEIKDSETYKYASATYTLNVNVNVSSLTDFLVAKPETTTVISEPVTVYYQSPDKKYMFITDGTTNMMVYGTLSNTYKNGDVLTGIAGEYDEYGGMDELIPDASTFGEATEGTPVEPKSVTLAEEIAPCDFVILTGVNITGVSGNNATVTDGTNSISAYDRFGLSLAATENATIVAIGAVYNSNKQLYIVSVTEEEPVIELGDIMFNDFVLDEGHAAGAFVGKAVTISAENAEVMSYTIDGGDLVEVAGSSFTWTPEEVGNYAFSVSAYLDGQDKKTVNFTVTVEEQPVGPEIEYPAYVKVNQAPVNNNWTGRYLIVYEDGNIAFDGSLTKLDASGNGKEVEISEGYIKATDELANSEFTIAAIEGSENAWSVKSASGYYIGSTTSSNELKSSMSTVYSNTISIAAGEVKIKGSSKVLQYNSATGSGNLRFRYYDDGKQKPIALYRYAASKADDPTAIEEVESVGSEAGEAQWYDLNGRRVAAPGKGIYILKQGNKATKYAF